MDKDPKQQIILITGEDAQAVTANRVRIALELLGMKKFDIEIVPIHVPETPQATDTAQEALLSMPPRRYECRTDIEEGELYKALVDLEKIPEIDTPPTAPAVSLDIMDDRSLKIGAREVIFKKHELFVVNALLISRNHPLTLQDFLEMGFSPSSNNISARRGKFTGEKNSVRSLLMAPGLGRSLVVESQTPGSARKQYQLDPTVKLNFTDRRPVKRDPR